MKIFHAPNTRSLRIVWLFEELGLPYDIEKLKLGDPAMRSPEYRRIHPMGRVPALEDGDVTLFESGAIVEYVLTRHAPGKLKPAVDSPDYPAYLQWFNYAEGMLMPPVNTIVVETMLLPAEKRNETNVKRATKLLGNMLTAIESALADREFLAREFSGADIMTGHATIVASRLAGDAAGDLPNVKAYVERLKARPALQKAYEV